jgi:hypothetical protein
MRDAEQHIYTGRRGQLVNIPASYSVSPGFKTPAGICPEGMSKVLKTCQGSRSPGPIFEPGTSLIRIRNVNQEAETLRFDVVDRNIYYVVNQAYCCKNIIPINF